MSNVPIVRGVENQALYGKDSHQFQHQQGQPQTPVGGATAYANEYPTEEELRLLRQNPAKQYQDVVWAVAFLAHLVFMIGFIALQISSFGGNNGNNNNNNNNNNNEGGGGSNSGIYFMVIATGLSAIGLTTAALSFMMKYAESLVQTALVFSVVSSLAVGILGFMMGSVLMGCVGIFSFAIGVCYAKIVWPRIPFAAANLNTALTAVRSNMGLAAVAYGFAAIAFAWSIFWFVGVGDALSSEGLVVIFLLFFSYYWVHQVLQNTMHVTTAGVIGTWWFVPGEANSWWSNALSSSLFRATTYSFGSICFGSLIVAVVQALRALEHYARGNDDTAMLACIIQCILACIQSIIEYFNRWAYVYIGLYGFSYLEAGRNVIQLFESKGWTVIISDNLADNVLFMMSIAIGLATGLIGLILGCLNPDMFAEIGFDHASGPGFLIGLLTGFLLSTIIMSVVGSAVNTVIVCYAEAPAEFQMNHPQLAANMRAAWMQAWPGVVM